MFNVVTNINYGVRTIDNRRLACLNTTLSKAPLTFEGLPVRISELCVKHIHNVKRWKRRNRPDKVRVRDYEIPTGYITNPPLSQRPTIICHPKIVERMEALNDKENL